MLGHMGPDGRVSLLPLGKQWPTERKAAQPTSRRATPLLGDGRSTPKIRRRPPQLLAGFSEFSTEGNKAKARPEAKAKPKRKRRPMPLWAKFTLGAIATMIPIGIAAYFDGRSGRQGDSRDDDHVPAPPGAAGAATEGPAFARVKGDTIEAVYTK